MSITIDKSPSKKEISFPVAAKSLLTGDIWLFFNERESVKIVSDRGLFDLGSKSTGESVCDDFYFTILEKFEVRKPSQSPPSNPVFDYLSNRGPSFPFAMKNTVSGAIYLVLSPTVAFKVAQSKGIYQRASTFNIGDRLDIEYLTSNDWMKQFEFVDLNISP